MEYIVGIAVVAAIIYLLTRKKEEVVETQPEAAPYKVEVINAQPVTKEEIVVTKPAPSKKPAAKKPAAPKTAAAKKPAAKKAPAKKPAAKTAKPKA